MTLYKTMFMETYALWSLIYKTIERRIFKEKWAHIIHNNRLEYLYLLAEPLTHIFTYKIVVILQESLRYVAVDIDPYECSDFLKSWFE